MIESLEQMQAQMRQQWQTQGKPDPELAQRVLEIVKSRCPWAAELTEEQIAERLRKRTIPYEDLDELTYYRMLDRQQGKCAICQDESWELMIDHDHSSGRVRALLCQACNFGLGFFRDDKVRMRAAIAYVTRFELPFGTADGRDQR